MLVGFWISDLENGSWKLILKEIILKIFNFELEEKLGPHSVRSKLLEMCGLFWASDVFWLVRPVYFRNQLQFFTDSLKNSNIHAILRIRYSQGDLKFTELCWVWTMDVHCSGCIEDVLTQPV